jgi:hypothetical protein
MPATGRKNGRFSTHHLSMGPGRNAAPADGHSAAGKGDESAGGREIGKNIPKIIYVH